MYRESVKHLYNLKRTRVPIPDNLTLRLHRLEKPEPWDDEVQIGLDPYPFEWSPDPESAIRLYPNLPPFYRQLSRFFGVPSDLIMVGSGIEDFLRSLFWLCCEPGQKAAVTWPTCAMFDVLAEMFGAELVRIKHGPDDDPTPTDFLKHLPEDLKVLFLPNPGQPVEILFGLFGLRTIARWCRERDILFVIDEAYWGFGAPTAIPLIYEFDNVLVLRTFSKVFGAAGIRVGCALGSPRAIGPLAALRLSTEVSGPSIQAASALLNHYESHVKPWADSVCDGRNWLREKLLEQGYPARGYWANHVLVEFPSAEKAEEVSDRLNERGIYVKARFPAPLERCLLITCGSQPYMERFYEQFRSCL